MWLKKIKINFFPIEPKYTNGFYSHEKSQNYTNKLFTMIIQFKDVHSIALNTGFWLEILDSDQDVYS